MDTFCKGCLERWDDDKGFGFIRLENEKSDVFIHISSLKNMTRRPIVGDVIYYQFHVDDNGKSNAINARIEGVGIVKAKKISRNKQKKHNNFFLLLLFVLAVVAGFFLYSKFTPTPQTESSGLTEFVASSISDHDLILQDAFQRRVSNIQVESEGTILKILPDDTEGSRHQKFIVRLNSAQTIMIAHNIEIAPKIDSIQEGDRIGFKGEYEWNKKGGVVHWTHHDPGGNHVAGWLKHDGQTYK